MGIWNGGNRAVRIRVTAADMTAAINALSLANIILYDVDYESDIVVLLTVDKRYVERTQIILHKIGCKCQLLPGQKQTNLFYYIRKRCVFIAGILILIVMTLWIPSRIFFVTVTGNDVLPQKKILQCAEVNGLTFGCARSHLRSEILKNKLIESLPELDWVGITTNGCVATIAVREKLPVDNDKDDDIIISSITASTDGVVESATATRGAILCKPGQAVYQGQILISGYEDCGLLVKACAAEGEVIASTLRSVEAISPRSYHQRRQITGRKVVYGLKVGKKFINFHKDSGISDTTCVKMYSEKYVTLPGGFSLPVSLIREEYIFYDTQMQSQSYDDFSWISPDSKDYLESQMVAGEVLSAREHTELLDSVFYFYGVYACREQIGMTKIEEILTDYGKDS